MTLRRPRAGDAAVLIAGRDEDFRRWLGPGSAEPAPTAVIQVDGAVVGWVDHEGPEAHPWLQPGQCNLGYHVFASHRGQGIASRAVRLLLGHLQAQGTWAEAVFVIDQDNEPSLRVARAVGAVELHRAPNADGRPQVHLGVPLGSRSGALGSRSGALGSRSGALGSRSSRPGAPT